MFRVIRFLLFTVTVLQLHWGLVEVAAIPGCDRSAATQCGNIALALSNTTNCHWAIIIPWFQSCTFNATYSCSEAEKQLWQDYISTFNQTLNSDICNHACDDQDTRAAELSECLQLNGGLSSVSSVVKATDAQPTDTVCDTVLQRIRECIDAASVGCPYLEDQAYNAMLPYEDTFDTCHIPLPDRQQINIQDFVDSGAMDVFPSTETPSVVVSEISATTQTVLYVMIGVCSLIVVGAGITALVLFINHKKEKKLNREMEYIKDKNTRKFEYPRGKKLSHWDHEEDLASSDSDDTASVESVGPYRPNGRWWTRPEFGMGLPPRPVDRQFRPWPGVRARDQ